jgi:hypothetical protein
LHPVTLHGIAMGARSEANKKGNHSSRRKSSPFRRKLRILHSLFSHPVSFPPIPKCRRSEK